MNAYNLVAKVLDTKHLCAEMVAKVYYYWPAGCLAWWNHFR